MLKKQGLFNNLVYHKYLAYLFLITSIYNIFTLNTIAY